MQRQEQGVCYTDW